MSLFQCEHCGCCENTALSHQGFIHADWYDWSYAPERKGKRLCSACGPMSYDNGSKTRYGGAWHNRFNRVFLPPGEFFTNAKGNLEHHGTGSERYLDFEISKPDCV